MLTWVFMDVERAISARGKNCYLPAVRVLAEAKKIALRKRVWYKLLNRVERGIIDLTVKYVNTIKSRKLAIVVTAIISKLQSATENTLDRLVRTIGLPLTRKISNIAINWGNRLASKWADDCSFAKFLVLNYAKI
jgi:hypothetical protein